SRPKRPPNVRPPFGPIDARAAKETAFGAGAIQINAETGQEFCPCRRDFARLAAKDDELALAQALREANPEHAGKMIVTCPRAPHCLIALRGRLKARRPCQSDIHNAFEHLPDMRSGEPVITVTALLCEQDKLRCQQLGEMTACRLRSNT